MATFVEMRLKPLQDNLRNNGISMSWGEQKLARLNLAVSGFFYAFADACVGMKLTCQSTFNKHQDKDLWLRVLGNASQSRTILAYPYSEGLKILNEDAKLTRNYDRDKDYVKAYLANFEITNPMISSEGDGLIAGCVRGLLDQNIAKGMFRESEKSILKHVASRLTYALTMVACVIARVVDGIIGIIAATFSFITLGKISEINNVAFRGLQFPGLIFDLCYLSTKVINPWAGH